MNSKRKKPDNSADKPIKKKKSSITASATWHTVCRAIPKVKKTKKDSIASPSASGRRAKTNKVTPKSSEKTRSSARLKSSGLSGSWSAASGSVSDASTTSSEKRKKDPAYLSPLLLTQKHASPPSSPARKPSPPSSPARKLSPPPSPARKPSPPPPSPARKHLSQARPAVLHSKTLTT